MNVAKLARWYRWIEYAVFGRALERSRFAFLPRLAPAQRVLILGEGDGRTLARLMELAPMARFDVVELSPQMIALAQKRLPDPGRVVFQCQDARVANWPAAHYDAIVAHFFLDCFTEEDARRLMEQMTRALTADGSWLISEFATPEKGWRRLHAQIWIGIMYRFFSVTTGLRTGALPPIENLMIQSGMLRVERRESRAGLIVSEVWRRA
jgi:spermidine synthase